MSTGVSKRVKTKAVEVVEDYELMKNICKDLLGKGILQINEMADIIKLLMIFRSEWSKDKQTELREKIKLTRDKDVWEGVKSYPHTSTPKSDTSSNSLDCPNDEPMSSSTDESPNSFSKLMPLVADPGIKNRKLTDDEIGAVDKDMQLVIDYGDKTHKSSLLKIFKTINPRFKECVSYINVKKKVKE